MQCAKHWSLKGLAVVLSALALMAPGGAHAAEEMLDGDRIETGQGDLVIHPVNHATFVTAWDDNIIYVDPVGGGERFRDLPDPDLILITHGHGDHLDPETLEAVATDETTLVVPRDVLSMVPVGLRAQSEILNNNESFYVEPGFSILAVPAYNTTKERMKYHPEGAGNGYVLSMADTNMYVAGDTEATPAMRNLMEIDVAFVPMNLPYTMPPEQAADGVLAFEPRIVYPYHYRGSDVQAFAQKVEANSDIEVRRRQWYE